MKPIIGRMSPMPTKCLRQLPAGWVLEVERKRPWRLSGDLCVKLVLWAAGLFAVVQTILGVM